MDSEHYLDQLFYDLRKEKEKEKEKVRIEDALKESDFIIYKEEVESGEHHFKKALHFVEKEMELAEKRAKSCPVEHTKVMNLEDEFNKIMWQVFQSIDSRVSSKEITKADGDALKILFNDKLYPAETFHENSDMNGWNSSQKCW